MLTKTTAKARPIAERTAGARAAGLLALHRRIELLVALIALAALSALVLDSEPASAQSYLELNAAPGWHQSADADVPLDPLRRWDGGS